MSIDSSRFVSSSSCVSTWYSCSRSGSFAYPGGNRRSRPSVSSLTSRSRSCPVRFEISSRSSSLMRNWNVPSCVRRTMRFAIRGALLVVLHGCPEAVFVQPEHVELGLLPGAVRDDGATLVMHVEHELRGLLARVAE